tara:strand:- start:583 stop:804 length:222 start_codon:yes stop_codon:yes gene_type:complete
MPTNLSSKSVLNFITSLGTSFLARKAFPFLNRDIMSSMFPLLQAAQTRAGRQFSSSNTPPKGANATSNCAAVK